MRIARSYARLVRQTMKIGLTALTLRPACVLGVFFVKKKENRYRLIDNCRKENALFAPPPFVELLSGDGLSRIEFDSSSFATERLLACSTGCSDVADCFHRMRVSGEIRYVFCWPGVWNKHLKMAEIGGIKLSPNPNPLAYELFAADELVLEPPLRSVRKPNTTESTAIPATCAEQTRSAISVRKFTWRWQREHGISRETVFCCTRFR